MSNLYTNRFKTIASTIAPDPLTANYWIDLTSDPSGKIIKYYNNGKWDTINSVSDAKIADLEKQIKALSERVAVLETPAV